MIRTERTIAADPLGVALVMAGPAAGHLWPAAAARRCRVSLARRGDHVDGGRWSAEVEVGGSTRAGGALLLPLTIAVGGGPPMAGSLSLAPMGAVHDAPATRAALTLHHEGHRPRRLRRLVARYLANVAAAAESTSQRP